MQKKNKTAVGLKRACTTPSVPIYSYWDLSCSRLQEQPSPDTSRFLQAQLCASPLCPCGMGLKEQRCATGTKGSAYLLGWDVYYFLMPWSHTHQFPFFSSGSQKGQQIDASAIYDYSTAPLECHSRCLLGKRVRSTKSSHPLALEGEWFQLVVFRVFKSCGEKGRCMMCLFVCSLAT